MAKNINVLLSLKDQFTKPLQNATKNTKEMDRHLQKASNKVKAFGNATKESIKSNRSSKKGKIKMRERF